MKYLYLFMPIILLTNCQNTVQHSNEEIEAIILQEIDGLYDVYTKSDLKWVDYYQDEFTAISTNGTSQLKKTEDLREQWQNIYDKYEVTLRDHGPPTLLVSQDQVVHYNTFDEILIKKETGDTTVSIGTWIVVWKKQEDNTWKINLETYHVKE